VIVSEMETGEASRACATPRWRLLRAVTPGGIYRRSRRIPPAGANVAPTTGPGVLILNVNRFHRTAGHGIWTHGEAATRVV